MKLEFYRQIVEKSSNIKFHENPSSGSRIVPFGRTDTTRLKSRFSQFCERAQKGNETATTVTPCRRSVCYAQLGKISRRSQWSRPTKTITMLDAACRVMNTLRHFFLCPVDRASWYNLRQWPTWYTLALFYNKFIIILYMFRALYAHHQEVELYWYSIWYRHAQ